MMGMNMLLPYRGLKLWTYWAARLLSLLLVAASMQALPGRSSEAALIGCNGNQCDGAYRVEFTPINTTVFEVDLDSTLTIQNNIATSWAFDDPAITIDTINIIPFIDDVTSEIRLGDLINFLAPFPESMFISSNGTYDCNLGVHCIDGTYTMFARIPEPPHAFIVRDRAPDYRPSHLASGRCADGWFPQSKRAGVNDMLTML